ncbi:hypothetical protein PENSPDRAFT_668652 [Peniophora sp. CONT]|nr:hypothetical protein PENSPDRAFT_668652 [Peniophora sp. CONT]
MSIRSILATTAVLSGALMGARADPVPNTPDTGIAGKTCTITWAEDTTGNWGQTAIELMTGDNQAMVHLTKSTICFAGLGPQAVSFSPVCFQANANVESLPFSAVTTLDTSKASSYSWTCPEVTINSAIYFYQFSAEGQSLTWTTRFALAGADGSTVAEPNATQPDGKAIPWGTGALSDPSTAVAAPSWLSSTGSNSTTSTGAATSAAASTSSSAATASSSSSAVSSAAVSSSASSAATSTSTGLVKVNSSSARSATSSAASTPSSSAANQSSANTSDAMSLRVPALALSFVAGVFAYAL